LEFIYENKNTDKLFNQRICELLNPRSTDAEFSKIIKALDEKRLYLHLISQGIVFKENREA